MMRTPATGLGSAGLRSPVQSMTRVGDSQGLVEVVEQPVPSGGRAVGIGTPRDMQIIGEVVPNWGNYPFRGGKRRGAG